MRRGTRPNTFRNTDDLKVGCILWYWNEDIDNPNAHPHIIVAIEDNVFFTVCGTSQMETVQRKANNLFGGDTSLFPVIRPNTNNKLKKDTFFDCTGYFEISIFTLRRKYDDGEGANASGKISFGEYEMLRSALKSNPTIDIIDILIHEED